MLMNEGKQQGCYVASKRCCERNKICGCLPQVAYVPVFVPTHCGNCQSTCKICEPPNKQDFAVGACQSANIRKYQNCNSDETPTNGCISGLNDQYYKLCLCDGNPHFSRVLIPQIGLPCQTDVSATIPSGNDKCAPCCQCQETSHNNRTLNVKYEWPESGRHTCALRRSSDDSGRVTWSDSGESIFSDYQIADPIRRNNIATQTTMMSTSRQRKISMVADFTAERRHQQHIPDSSSLKLTGYLPYYDESPSYPRSNHSDETHSSQNSDIPGCVKNTVSSDWKQSKVDSGIDCHSKSVPPTSLSVNSVETAKYQRDDAIAERCTRTPRRSSSDWMLRKMDKMTVKPRKSRLDSLQEQEITPRRPRSKSLFVGAGRHPLLLSRTKTHDKASSGQTHQLDFTSWHSLKKTWNIGENGPDEIGKSYGLVAVPSMQGIAITNTNDVKIKIYKTDGEKILAFGTPTWPNHGRAITRSNTGEHLIVSHISGVCTYALDGKLVNRYSHENTPGLFWGVACDNDGNHVVTDPKSSSIFIMTAYGDVLRQIGGESTTIRTRSNPSKRSRRGKKKLSNEKQLSADRLNNVTDSYGENPVTSAVSKMTGCGPDKEKKQARLLAPRYVAVNSKNQILVTDTTQRCLLIMENDGTQLFTVGGGRSGCHRCRRPTDCDSGKNIQNVISATDFCIRIPVQLTPTKEPLSRKSSDNVFEREENQEPAANYFAEICGNKANCNSKSARPKVLGAISRAQIGRGESVESQTAYQTATHKKSLKAKSKTPKEEWDSQSSRVAYRLSSHMREMSIEYDSCLDLSLDKETKDTTAPKHRMKIFRKSVKGMWKGKDRKKRKLGQSDASKCDSLTSLSCDTSTGNEQLCDEDLEMSQRFSNPKVEIEQATRSVCSSDTDEIIKHHSAPDVSPRADFDFSDPLSPTTLDFETNYGRRHSDDSCSLDVAQELESDEDNDTSSCRKCHVGDPRGICVDKNDNILLADYARHRVSVFDPTGHFVRHLLTEKDGLRQPNALCVIDDSTIAVKDSAVGIKIFQFVAGE